MTCRWCWFKAKCWNCGGCEQHCERLRRALSPTEEKK